MHFISVLFTYYNLRSLLQYADNNAWVCDMHPVSITSISNVWARKNSSRLQCFSKLINTCLIFILDVDISIMVNKNFHYIFITTSCCSCHMQGSPLKKRLIEHSLTPRQVSFTPFPHWECVSPNCSQGPPFRGEAWYTPFAHTWNIAISHEWYCGHKINFGTWKIQNGL